jgi:ATPase
MSLHIKENAPIIRKKGEPGNRKPVVDTAVMNKVEFKKLVDDIYQEIESRDDGFLEIDRKLSKILQLGPYRIVIVYPPLSDGLEMTIVKPIKTLEIEDYKLTPETFELLRYKSKGILVSGAPGSGKTTFAQALIDVYHRDNNIIKTLESPRDLLVSDDIVQYSFTYGTHDEVRDILLLSRPDYTVYDEVRNTSDFELYKDLRLTGIGLVGVIHATRPVDSIQRFL